MGVDGRRRRAPRASILAVLRVLGVDLESPLDAADALAERRRAEWARLTEPVIVAEVGEPAVLTARLPADVERGAMAIRVEPEAGEDDAPAAGRRIEPASGEGIALDVPVLDCPVLEASGDRRRVARRVSVPVPLPVGAHRLRLEAGGEASEALLLVAPRRVVAPARRGWGVFLPLHAMRSRRSLGIGDLGDLEDLLEWTAELGGSVVATLPFLAGFPGEASPYAPASRLFWDERYLDVEALPEVASSPAARRLLGSDEVRRARSSLRRRKLVDHARVAAAKRRILEAALSDLGDRRRAEVDAFARRRPGLEAYARFRAAGERHGLDWRRWPTRLRDGRIRPADVDPAAVAYHRAAQWLMEERLGGLAARARDRGAGLYLDVPLGVHPDGFDVWHEPRWFAEGTSVGAPPDDFFLHGQDWGFPPLLPERIREDGYRYPAACLRHALRHAGVVRIDHVMGFHRQYWVPHGEPADRGVYVRYRPEEWYALLAIGSRRSGTVVVGEDLGTVPPGVRAMMRRRGLLQSYVLQSSALPRRGPALRRPPARSLAGLNTHDMPPFAAFWRGLDLDERLAGGLLTGTEAEAERRRRARVRAALVRELRAGGWLTGGRSAADETEEGEVLAACLRFLASSEADLVVVGLEDLWGETRPQNLPGVPEHPSWRRRAAHPLEAIRVLPAVVDRLRQVHELRAAVSRQPRPTRGDR